MLNRSLHRYVSVPFICQWKGTCRTKIVIEKYPFLFFLRLNWSSSNSLLTDIMQKRSKIENLFKVAKVLSAAATECISYQLWSQENMKALLPVELAFYPISHQNLLFWWLPTFFGNPEAIHWAQKGKKERGRGSNLDCQTLQFQSSLMKFHEAKQQNNLFTHNTSEDLWSNKLILRAVINL